MNKNCVLLFGVGGHIGPSILEELIDKYFIIGVSRSAKNIRNHDNYIPIEFDFQADDIEKLYLYIQDIVEQNYLNVVGSVINFVYGSPSIPDSLTDEDIYNATFGVFARQIQLAKFSMKLIQKEGSVVVISSMYAGLAPSHRNYQKRDQFNPLLYGAMKAALETGTKWLASFNSERSVRFNIIRLGPFPSIEVQRDNDEFVSKLSNATLSGTIGRPINAAKAITFILSEDSSYINGSVVNIDGGWSTC